LVHARGGGGGGADLLVGCGLGGGGALGDLLFDQAHKLRTRARERTPGAFVALGRAARALGEAARTMASNLVRRLERAVPEDARIRRHIETNRPDLLLITPLIDLGSSQIDDLRAARALGIPTALCVWSWDHLSSRR
jgi:hypothetical protein